MLGVAAGDQAETERRIGAAAAAAAVVAAAEAAQAQRRLVLQQTEPRRWRTSFT